MRLGASQIVDYLQSISTLTIKVGLFALFLSLALPGCDLFFTFVDLLFYDIALEWTHIRDTEC